MLRSASTQVTALYPITVICITITVIYDLLLFLLFVVITIYTLRILCTYVTLSETFTTCYFLGQGETEDYILS